MNERKISTPFKLTTDELLFLSYLGDGNRAKGLRKALVNSGFAIFKEYMESKEENYIVRKEHFLSKENHCLYSHYKDGAPDLAMINR